MTDTDKLLDALEQHGGIEVDHAIEIYLEPGSCLPWSDTEKIRSCGYKIQDVTNEPDSPQAKVTLVKIDD